MDCSHDRCIQKYFENADYIAASISASHFKLLCENDKMTAVFKREDLPKHMNVRYLYLRNRRCRAHWNSTHVIVRTSLTGCGTVFSKDEKNLYFSNVLSEDGYDQSSGIISRDYLFRVNLTCSYPRKRTVGSFNFAPARRRMFVSLCKSHFCLLLFYYAYLPSTVRR